MARRGRPPKDLQPPVETAELPEHDLKIMQSTATAVTEEAFGWMQASMLAGRLQTATCFGEMADHFVVEIYRQAKESKCYVGMPYRHPDGKTETVSTLEDFCRLVLGKGQRRVEQLVSNQRLLGDLYEHAQQVGLRQRDFNAIKALPATDQEVIKQALEEGADRETVVEKLVNLAERQAREKQSLSEDLGAKEQRIANQAKQMDRLNDRLAKVQRAWKDATPDERAAKLRSEFDFEVLRVCAMISSRDKDAASIRTRFEALLEYAEYLDAEADVRMILAGKLDELEQHIQLLRDEFHLPGSVLLND